MHRHKILSDFTDIEKGKDTGKGTEKDTEKEIKKEKEIFY